MKKHLLKRILPLLLAAVLLPVLAASVLAADISDIDFDRTGTISATMRGSGEGHPAIPNTSFRLYKVADMVKEGSSVFYAYTEEFRGNGASLGDLRESGLPEHLEDYAQRNNLTPRIATAGAEGTAVFSGLELGLYLLTQNGTVEGYYSASPFLVSLPMEDAVSGEWAYEVHAFPKVQEVPPVPTTISRAVLKVWNDNNDGNRPTSIRVNLLRDGVVFDTVTLSAENNWRFVWEQLDAAFRWSVAEETVPTGYIVRYGQQGMTLTITNSLPTDKPIVVPVYNVNNPGGLIDIFDEDVPLSGLIQTGQLNWPVPILAGGGMLLFALGWNLKRQKREESE